MFTLYIRHSRNTGNSYGLFKTTEDAVRWLTENGWKRNQRSSKKLPIYQKKDRHGAVVFAVVNRHLEVTDIDI
jgi:hypothetical protein